MSREPVEFDENTIPEWIEEWVHDALLSVLAVGEGVDGDFFRITRIA